MRSTGAGAYEPAAGEATTLVQRRSAGSDAADGGGGGERLLLCASNVPDKGTLMRATLGSVTCVEYDFDSPIDPEKLVRAATWAGPAAAQPRTFESIGLVVHGGPGKIRLTKRTTISRDTMFNVEVSTFVRRSSSPAALLHLTRLLRRYALCLGC